MRQLLLSVILLSIAFVAAPHQADREESAEAFENPLARQEWERIRLCDPSTGKIPDNVRARELSFATNLPSREGLLAKSNSAQDNTWSHVGPNNIGGRTRAVAIDISDEKTLLAGAVSGGIWKSLDAGASWHKTTAPTVMMDVTCLVQDQRVGKRNVWYAGTGELWGGSSELRGSGMYKSVDNGESWTSITATYNNTPEAWDNGFEFIWRIVCDHTNLSQDVVYAATALGSIQRSTNGGQSWTTVLGGFANGFGYFTDIAIAPSGVLYATVSQQTSPSGTPSTTRGVFRSTDGVKWTNISPSFLPAVFGRIALGIAPSDEKQVYFIANTPGSGFREVDFRGREDWNSLWKYDYISGDGTGSGGSWDNRSANLPKLGGMFGDFQSQGSYDLHVRVHPQNPDVVFVGGTNLYRSDNGFTSPTWFWCGGYGPGSALPFYEVYPNNHPDQHELIFYPSHPDWAICACDGGLFKSDNIRAGTVAWSSLNNGYLSTQFYTCAVDHKKSNAVIIGGLQDNGTVFGHTLNASVPWTSPGRGDGSYCAVADDGNYYMSSQQGTMARFDLDSIGVVKRYARIDPKGTKRDSFLFINPFALDPNDNKRLYMTYRHSIFRCSDLTLTPWGSWDTAATAVAGWDTLPVPGTSRVLSAVSLSTVPSNRLYYGTQDGYLYRVDGANAASVTQREITGANFTRGNIECICVNPHNADSLLVVFSNYSIQSLFFSGDGGSTWQAVGGNLEGAMNGVGNGPSCRWAKFTWVNGKLLSFVGTSIGLFSTAYLNGANTVWLQEGASSIGNNVVTMMDYREQDNFMAVATHGNGMYAGTIRDLPPPPDVPELDAPIDQKRAVYPQLDLSWKSAANAVFYGIQISSFKDFNVIAISADAIRPLTYTASTLTQGRVDYYWRVRAMGAGGVSAYSTVRTFRTAIDAPELVAPSPAAQAQPQSLSLVWNRREAAIRYRVQLATSFSFGTPVLDTTLTDTTVAVSNLLAAKKYYWRVLAGDEDGDGLYSNTRNFSTGGSVGVDDELMADRVRVYPSVAQDLVHIDLSPSQDGVLSIEITDVRGRRVTRLYDGPLNSAHTVFQWHCSQVANGTYAIIVRENNKVHTHWITVQH